MTRRPKFIKRKVFPILSTILIYVVNLGCSETTNIENMGTEKGAIYFAMETSSKIKSPLVEKIALEEGMRFIESGEFLMGSPPEEPGHSSDEKINRVKISQPFWLKKAEVTQEEWNEVVSSDQKKGVPVYSLSKELIEEICDISNGSGGTFSIGTYMNPQGIELFLEEAVFTDGSLSTPKKPISHRVNPTKFKDLESLLTHLVSKQIKPIGRLDKFFPVSRVSYSQAVAFCWQKTERARLNNSLPSPLVYRLPTEAEWEYACRAGTLGLCGLGEGNFLSGENANIDGSLRGYIIDQRPKSEFSDGRSFISIFRKGLVPIRKNSSAYPENAWGLQHMHGNVLEWCYDFYGPYPEGNYTRIDPMGPINGTQRIVRGGSFVRTAHESRSAKRLSYEASYRGCEIGFRYVLGLPLR